MRAETAVQVRDYLIQMVDLFHRRYIVGPSIGDRDIAVPEASMDAPWFDTKIPGVAKLNWRPLTMNLELKIVSLATKQVDAPRRGLVTVPAEQFIVNAHIIKD